MSAKEYDIEAIVIDTIEYRTRESRNPPIFTLSPSGIATKVIKTHWVRSTSASLRTLPKRIAERLTGVTRNLSITPDRISSIRLNPTNAEPKSAIITRSPGMKICTVFPAGRPGTPPRPFRRGMNRNRYKRGWNKLTNTKMGLRRVWRIFLININCIPLNSFMITYCPLLMNVLYTLGKRHQDLVLIM